MKIVHISDSDGGGGAAHAMSRLHGALRRFHVDSRMLVRSGSAPGNLVETVATRGDADELFPAVRDAVVRQYVELNRTSRSNTHFSLHIDGADLSRVPLVASSDIVHLHWTASFQTPADVRTLFDTKPVVWTLHDLEPLTGGCHFTAGCERYAGDCARCPQLERDPFRVTETTLRDKKTLWAGARPTFIAPSRYMAERARLSAVAQRAGGSIVHIPHGIDVAAFRPRSKAEARRALGVPVDGLYVLCGSNYNAEKRKGLGLLSRILGDARARSQLTLLTVGEPKFDLEELGGIDVVQLGRVSVDVMPMVYAAADMFLHPAIEDNFPLMLLESLSCGTPAIAFDIGGVADMLQDEVCGRLVAAGDELAMAAALSSLVRDREKLQRMGEHARAHIEAHFSDVAIAREHAELYDEVLADVRTPRAPASRPRKTGLEQIFPRWSTACLVQELAFARERASLLLEGARARSQRIAALERDAAELAQTVADRSREVEEKEAELTAVHHVADERKALADELHTSAASAGALAERLQRTVDERDDLLAKYAATIDEQRAEIALVHQVADERRLLIETLHGAASEHVAALEREIGVLGPSVADQSRQVEEKQAELIATYAVADEREALAASLHMQVRERDDLVAMLRATIDEQRAEIVLVHRIAEERRLLIEDVHRSAAEQIAALEPKLPHPH